MHGMILTARLDGGSKWAVGQNTGCSEEWTLHGNCLCQEIQVGPHLGVWRLTGELLCSCRLWSLHPLYSSLLSWSCHMYQSYLEEDKWLRFHCAALHKCIRIQKWRFKNDVSWRHKWLRSIKSSESGFSYGGVAWLCTLGRSLNANKTTANILLKSFCLLLREIDRTVTATSSPKLLVTLVIRWTVVDSSSKAVL